ncbi:deoxycytidyl transferase [Chytridiales sp. JEL 0842]|nr:deoxycytidyl transferase [Chytridiales sp. JEL 0842]
MAYQNGRDYMAEKARKQQEQNKTSGIEVISTVFTGTTLYYDGYLGDMTLLDWRDRALAHGATVVDHLTTSVTHVIANHLTDRKIELWKNRKVVRTDWIDDSIAKKQMQPWHLYAVIPSNSARQKTLLSFGVRSPNEKASGNLPVQSPTRKGPTPGVENTEWAKQNIATAPGFMNKYFSSSRLSKLSNWKSDLRDYVATKMKEADGRGAAIAASALAGKRLRTILHVDMDCFFATVAIRDRPHLKDKPVAICHSSGQGVRSSTSEIASCNYIAREFGVKNGMLLGSAQKLCKDLVVCDYEFEKYYSCSTLLYDVLLKFGDVVMAVSCDEAYIDVSSRVAQRGTCEREIAEQIRAEVLACTGCVASIGIGDNMLIARVATKKAKPNGVFLLQKEKLNTLFNDLSVTDLPGVGYTMTRKLHSMRIQTCGDLARLSLLTCKKEFGEANGQRLWEFCRGVDNRPLQNPVRQSVGAEINWGVRFEHESQVEKFVMELAEEVQARMKRIQAKGRCITVKVKRKLYDGEPMKVLGCGECLDLSRRLELNRSIDSADVIGRESVRILQGLNIPCTELRGIGIHVSKLDDGPEVALPAGQTKLDFKPAPKRKLDIDFGEPNSESPAKKPALFDLNRDSSNKSQGKPTSPPKEKIDDLPTLSQIDPEVLKSLPNDIREELEAALHKKYDNQPVPAYLERQPVKRAKLSLKGVFMEPTGTPLATCLEPDDIRNLIRRWLNDCHEPKGSDVEYMTDFLRRLIRNWQLDNAVEYVNLMKRCVYKMQKGPIWRATIQRLEKIINRESLHTYQHKVK